MWHPTSVLWLYTGLSKARETLAKLFSEVLGSTAIWSRPTGTVNHDCTDHNNRCVVNAQDEVFRVQFHKLVPVCNERRLHSRRAIFQLQVVSKEYQGLAAFLYRTAGSTMWIQLKTVGTAICHQRKTNFQILIFRRVFYIQLKEFDNRAIHTFDLTVALRVVRTCSCLGDTE